MSSPASVRAAGRRRNVPREGIRPGMTENSAAAAAASAMIEAGSEFFTETGCEILTPHRRELAVV
jgi:hypothetical protein